ncbi:MAG: RNA-binding cell elongation regulator Jag/EloR [Streptococcus hyointestinalis]|nr:RNA-binding cell elongation regulator Jag/EloR [Streptococcus hyointestinalis]MCI6871309.1 protein jag [Streptococcus hyointestinalis]MDD7356802.1 protein jag [Streptococcus hyointestinalis]MDY4553572.1 RNA-binding cell elongation regulator Jag/EloR [Streptococcus hyointestinalis]
MVVFTGRTVEEAISKGLDELGLTRLKAHIRVISREKKGFLGFGKRPAQVDIESLELEKTARTSSVTRHKVTSITERLNRDMMQQNESVTIVGTSNEPASAKSEVATKEELEPKVKEEVTASIQPLEEEPAPSAGDSFEAFVATAFDNNKDEAQTIDITEAATQVKNYVERIIYEMDLEASIETTTKRRQINLQIETPEPGRIIGYHGKVLKSLQLLAQNYLYDHYSKAFSVSVNVHDYVEHRTETLIDFSQKIASRVLASGQDFRMDPMSNSERKIVHKAISHIDGVDSYSEGSDPNRYVVVTVKN